MPWVSWLPCTVAPPFFANASSSPASVIGSEPTSLTTKVGFHPSLSAASLSSAVNAGMEYDTTTWAPEAVLTGSLRAEIGVGDRGVGLHLCGRAEGDELAEV